MDWPYALIGAFALLAASTVLGLLWKARTGRAEATTAGAPPAIVLAVELADPASAAPAPTLGERATLLQFSTEFCARCPQTRTLLAGIADAADGVSAIEIDLGARPELARRFRVMQTPTVLMLDAAGVVRARIGGAPDRRTVTEQLALILERDPHVTAIG
ncbi:thioredoxin [Microterricola gilva]|uniref:Thioredoxin n=1 Tax=Microterricola gilva TaxID=393267 RepID=A0A4Q8AML7_9MICO|nr:thioredoxin family protein [Microterricola gilva]RZU65748.1 thioredoxin [Microterricola gilva]